MIIILFLTALSCNFSFDKDSSEKSEIGNWKNCLRYADNSWNKTIGPAYIEKAFLAARAADPAAKLFYNDYNLNNEYKAKAVYKMVMDINNRYPNIGGRKLIDGIGMQSHHHLKTDPLTVKASIQLFSSLGVDIAVSEMDIMAVGDFGYPPETFAWNITTAQLQAEQYAAMFDIFREYSSNISRVTFWGLDDGTSWRGGNRTDGPNAYPALLNSDYSLKLAFDAVAGIEAGESAAWNTVQSLYEIYEDDFLMGNVISSDDPGTIRFNILKRHYNIVTAENEMKPDHVAPLSNGGAYRWAQADTIVNAALTAGLLVHGHTLVWHQQTPSWLNSNSATALSNLEKYVSDVTTHFREKVISWDVVNEAIRDGLTANDVK